MGGGGNVFKQAAQAIAQSVGDIVNTTKKTVVGGSDVMPTPSSQKRDAGNAARQAQQSAAATATAQEGGTPTANASQASKSAGSAAALSGSQQAVNQTSGSGTMLTGNAGVDPQSLELGRRTLLGG